jgi:hypothetical protein
MGGLNNSSISIERTQIKNHRRKTMIMRESRMSLKEGDRVRISLIGEDYRVKWIGDRMVVWEAEDKSTELLTTMDNLKSYSSPQNPKIREKIGLQVRN